MTIVLIIAIAVMAGCMAMLTFKLSDIEKKVSSDPAEAKATAVNKRLNDTITTYNTRFSSADAKQADVEAQIGTVQLKQDEADKQIDEIISKLESIAVSIGNIENRQTVDRRKLNDICTRYVLYRKPEKVTAEDIAQALTEYKCGVPWAKYQPCNDEGE